MRIPAGIFVGFVGLCLLTGCATSRSVVSLDQGEAVSVNPPRGQEVAIVSVEDARAFELAPRTPDIPSLSDGQISNTAITARAIARKRNTWGAALGDVLLPEGKTVAEAMRSAVANSFRKAGYRVVGAGEPGFEKASPVSARVVQYWSWMQPGFWALSVNNRAEIVLTGPLPALGNGLRVQSETSESMQAVFESDWQRVSAKGLESLADKLTLSLREPR